MRAKDKLRATWSERENDVMLHYPLGLQTVSDGRYLSGVFDDVFTEQMESRGYDITTLKFSIEPKAGNEKFASQREK